MVKRVAEKGPNVEKKEVRGKRKTVSSRGQGENVEIEYVASETLKSIRMHLLDTSFEKSHT